jgi:hypothetical protein
LGSTLLLIEKATHDPLYLWDINGATNNGFGQRSLHQWEGCLLYMAGYPVPPYFRVLMTHKYRGCIIEFSINKSVEPNEEQKVLTSGFDQGFTVNTSERVFRGMW